MQPESREFPKEELLSWFKQNKRALPWRHSPSFYEVLVSEFMLQQTVASTVVPYYLKWMEMFPTLLHLAQSTELQVLKAWEGLGYYSRAKRLHSLAIELAQKEESYPESYEDLKKYKGIGDYTAKALRAFAFNHPDIALDGNVLRVGARFFGVDDVISSPVARRKIQKFFDEVDKVDGEMAEALIELGATLCKKKADCLLCPLKSHCYAFKNQKTQDLPRIAQRKKILKIESMAVVCCVGQHVLVKKITEKLMKDLYQFPQDKELDDLNLQLEDSESMGSFKRSFTNFQETIHARFCKLDYRHEIPGCEWVDLKKLLDLPFSSGHRTIREITLKKIGL